MPTYERLHTHINEDGNPLIRDKVLWSLPWTLDVCMNGLQEWPTGETVFMVSFPL